MPIVHKVTLYLTFDTITGIVFLAIDWTKSESVCLIVRWDCPLSQGAGEIKDQDKTREQLIAEENMTGGVSSPSHCHWNIKEENTRQVDWGGRC